MVLAAAAVERAMKRQEVIMRALSGTLTWLQAADILGVEPRSVRRWRARFEAGGAVALYDRRQLPSPRKAPALEVQHIVRLYRERFTGWNVRHFYRFARRDHRVYDLDVAVDHRRSGLRQTQCGNRASDGARKHHRPTEAARQARCENGRHDRPGTWLRTIPPALRQPFIGAGNLIWPAPTLSMVRRMQ